MLDPKTTRKLSGFSDDIYKLQNELEKLFKQVEDNAKLGNIEQLNLFRPRARFYLSMLTDKREEIIQTIEALPDEEAVLTMTLRQEIAALSIQIEQVSSLIGVLDQAAKSISISDRQVAANHILKKCQHLKHLAKES